MRIFVTAALGLALTLGLSISVPAEADTVGCVSLTEFRSAKPGMTPRQVAALFDTRGELVDGAGGGFAQGYKRCGAGGVLVTFAWTAEDNREHLADKRWSSLPFVNCVTIDEWRSVYIVPNGTGSGPGTGGTMARIHRVFGTAGRVVRQFSDGSEGTWQIRKYKRCGSLKMRTVEYHKRDGSAWWSYWG